MWYACKSGEIELVKFLLDQKVNVNIKGKEKDEEILKTPTGKTTTFLILEISTENFMNKTIDEHIIDSQNNVIGDVSTKILGTKTFYDNQLYHYFYEKIQNNVDSNLM